MHWGHDKKVLLLHGYLGVFNNMITHLRILRKVWILLSLFLLDFWWSIIMLSFTLQITGSSSRLRRMLDTWANIFYEVTNIFTPLHGQFWKIHLRRAPRWEACSPRWCPGWRGPRPRCRPPARGRARLSGTRAAPAQAPCTCSVSLTRLWSIAFSSFFLI